MAKVGTLAITFTSDMAKVIRDFDRTSKAARRSSKDISGSLDFMKKALVGFLGYQTLKHGAEFIHQQMEIIDQNAKMADSFGVSTEALSTMSLVAKEDGSSIQALAGFWQKMSKTIYDSATATGKQTDAFTRLNLDAKALITLSPDKQFEKVAAALSKLQNPTERLALAQQIFGKASREVLNIISDFPAKFADAAAFTHKFGLDVSRIDSAKVEQANDAFGRIGIAIGGIAGKIGVELAPVIEGISKAFIGGIDGADKWALGTATAIDGVIYYLDKAIVHIKSALSIFEKTTIAMGGIGAAIVARAQGDKALAYRVLNETTDAFDKVDADTEDWLANHAKLADYLRKARQESEDAAKKTAAQHPTEGGMGGNFISKLPTDFAEGWKSGLDKTNLYFEDFASISEKLVVDSFKGMEDALVNFVKTGKMDFKSMVDSMLSDLIRLQVRKSITEPLFNMLGSGKDGGILGSILRSIGNAFAGMFADGGYVPPGKWGIAGESGAEAVFGGKTGVSVVPQGGKGGDTYIIDARGADQSGLSRLENMIRTMNGTIEHRAVRAVSDAQLRGVI